MSEIVNIPIVTTPSTFINSFPRHTGKTFNTPYRRVVAMGTSPTHTCPDFANITERTTETLSLTDGLAKKTLDYFAGIVICNDVRLPINNADGSERPEADYNCYHYGLATRGRWFPSWREVKEHIGPVGGPVAGELAFEEHAVLWSLTRKMARHYVVGIGGGECMQVMAIGGNFGICPVDTMVRNYAAYYSEPVSQFELRYVGPSVRAG